MGERTSELFIWPVHLPSQGPTIYPILFASVVGRATYAILLWRLEKGEKIGTLDILAGSTSLTSTVVSQFQLRLVSFVGIGLVAIWILSPVGGQSSFRQISFGPSNDPEDASFQYLVPGAYMWTPLDFGFSLIIDQTYVAALLNAVANGSPRDSWGHVKVPRIEHYEHTSSPSRDGWYNTTSGPRDSYSSLIGIPMNVTEPAESAHYINYTTTIDAMYFHLDCDMLPFQEDPVFENHGDCWLGYTYWNESSIERAKLPPDELRPFAFGLDGGPDLGPILNYSLSCTVESAYVEVEVSCATHDTCAASRVRRSKLDPSPPPVAYTWLDLERDDMNTMWDTITWGTTPGLQNLSLAYLWNPENPIAPVLEVPSSEDASIRVEQMLNTYWAAMNNRMVSLGSIGNDTTWLDNNISWPFQDGSQNMDLFDDNNPKQVEARQKARTWLSKGKKLDNTEIFKAHWGWVVALLLSSTVLIAASLIPFYIRCFLSQSPGILMNFSSLAIRDNVYLAPPATGTYLGAADRLRYLKDVRIRFGDVDEGNGTGTLAIARLGEVAALKKGRKYA
jgi:hypothetical protein